MAFFTISIHALLAESDTQWPITARRSSNFYPRSPCGERRVDPVYHGRIYRISIHALLAESDKQLTAAGQNACNFYPRSPCGERRSHPQCPPPFCYFYPRSPCGERPQIGTGGRWLKLFLSTLSLRRATARKRSRRCGSTHFYPRSPCGERREQGVAVFDGFLFLSTLSLRRATAELTTLVNKLFISIHALLAESDGFLWHFCPCDIIFLSTLSLRRATFGSGSLGP